LLSALPVAAGGGKVPRPVALAGWFHDAVHDGVAGEDEEHSARLAEVELAAAGLPAEEVAEVARLVRLTVDHDPEEGDIAGAVLVDADLSILGQPPARYHMYSRDVRLEYPRVGDELFAAGRLEVLKALSSREPLFGLTAAQREWSVQAGQNLAVERRRWSRFTDQGR
jgi:predicted metal-dependent HD superfamily phosphohydrolase